jgi:Cytochrome bd terminal oxidase subunit I
LSAELERVGWGSLTKGAMTDLFAARSQMAISLGFHIIFAAIGIAMPFFMAISHWRWLKTKEPVTSISPKPGPRE